VINQGIASAPVDVSPKQCWQNMQKSIAAVHQARTLQQKAWSIYRRTRNIDDFLFVMCLDTYITSEMSAALSFCYGAYGRGSEGSSWMNDALWGFRRAKAILRRVRE